MLLSDIHKFVSENKEMWNLSLRHVHAVNRDINGRVCNPHIVHWLFVIREYMKEECKNYLEVGVLHGGTMNMIMKSSYPVYCVGIDIFSYYGNTHDKRSSTVVSLANTKRNIDSANKHNHKFDLIEGNSQDTTVIEQSYKMMPSVDLMYIDGDHSYNGLMTDIENYHKRLRPGGTLILDDYGHRAWPDIARCVDDIKDEWGLIKRGAIKSLYILEKS